MTLFQLEIWQIAVLFTPMLFVFWSLWHIFSHTFPSVQERFYWLLLCSFLPVLGTVIYIIFGYKRAK